MDKEPIHIVDQNRPHLSSNPNNKQATDNSLYDSWILLCKCCICRTLSGLYVLKGIYVFGLTVYYGGYKMYLNIIYQTSTDEN